MLILNNVHFFKNDDEGQNMLLQLQQRWDSLNQCLPARMLNFVSSSAEGWAASGM